MMSLRSTMSWMCVVPTALSATVLRFGVALLSTPNGQIMWLQLAQW